MSLDDRPDEKGDTGRGNEKSFGGEKMANFVDGEPDGWQAAGPEEEEADGISCDRSWANRHDIGKIFIGSPNRADH